MIMDYNKYKGGGGWVVYHICDTPPIWINFGRTIKLAASFINIGNIYYLVY